MNAASRAVADLLQPAICGSTGFVAFFVWDFQINEAEEREKKMSLAGILMMFGYLSVDSFTSNFQDLQYSAREWRCYDVDSACKLL